MKIAFITTVLALSVVYGQNPIYQQYLNQVSVDVTPAKGESVRLYSKFSTHGPKIAVLRLANGDLNLHIQMDQKGMERTSKALRAVFGNQASVLPGRGLGYDLQILRLGINQLFQEGFTFRGRFATLEGYTIEISKKDVGSIKFVLWLQTQEELSAFMKKYFQQQSRCITWSSLSLYRQHLLRYLSRILMSTHFKGVGISFRGENLDGTLYT
eukprot:TRINITY_DN10988_c0_g1_i1.p1 TRINITY_DN10988_c0_g1~~TRINITY_DN10988_c0_g1_i1.p1  ORF type:complete len:212 (-),score=13.48 TRINITY_DN10988_c0_g1_i1:90-725(-)